MYSVHAYYAANMALVFTCVWIYPIPSAILTFYFIDFLNGSFANLLYFMVILSIISVAGAVHGVMLSCFISNEM